MKNVKVEQLIGHNGQVKNQFIIYTEEGKYFQSYHTVIAYRDLEGNITLDAANWDYSTTTGKYRNIFLRENKAETEKKIRTGVYKLVDLNN